jgi:hypothetical protein
VLHGAIWSAETAGILEQDGSSVSVAQHLLDTVVPPRFGVDAAGEVAITVPSPRVDTVALK